jgi:hypothetical protein
MANLNEAFEIALNRENLAFAQHPYQPIRVIGQRSGEPTIDSRQLTIARCFDIQCGCQCPSPQMASAYGQPRCTCNKISYI